MAVATVLIAAAFANVFPRRSVAAERGPQLQRASFGNRPDGSVQMILTFDSDAPDARVVRSDAHTVHVVLLGATLKPRFDDETRVPHGEVVGRSFAAFAGIGARVDLRLRDRADVRTEKHGTTLIVDIPPQPRTPRTAALAAPVPYGAPRTMLVRLSYADVSEVAGALVKGAAVPSNDAFNATSPFVPPPPPATSFTSSSSSSSQQVGSLPTYVSIPATTLLPKDTPLAVRFDDHVAVDRRLNAVILTGTPEELGAYQAVIAQLDVPSRSVLLDTEIVELTETGAKDLGIDFSSTGSLATATFSANTDKLPTASLTMGARVDALERSGQAKILAQPRIITLNNRPAAILSGEAVPITNAIVIPGGGSTLVNNQVQYINVGVSLQILPRVADNSRVTTQIFAEVSSIIDYVGYNPRIAVRQELTAAVVHDAESLVVGGLLQDTEISSLSKVPGIGNLPLIGGLFRSISRSSQKTNLYIVVTPHIITNAVGETTGAANVTPASPTPATVPYPDGAPSHTP